MSATHVLRARPSARWPLTVAAGGVALGCGAALYLGRGATRAEALLGHAAPVAALRASVAGAVHRLPGWLQDSGADAAWSFALGVVVAAVAGGGRAGVGWRLAGLALAAGWELGQAAGVVRGTFDPFDLAGITLAYALAMVLTRPGAPSSTPVLGARP